MFKRKIFTNTFLPHRHIGTHVDLWYTTKLHVSTCNLLSQIVYVCTLILVPIIITTLKIVPLTIVHEYVVPRNERLIRDAPSRHFLRVLRKKILSKYSLKNRLYFSRLRYDWSTDKAWKVMCLRVHKFLIFPQERRSDCEHYCRCFMSWLNFRRMQIYGSSVTDEFNLMCSLGKFARGQIQRMTLVRSNCLSLAHIYQVLLKKGSESEMKLLEHVHLCQIMKQ